MLGEPGIPPENPGGSRVFRWSYEEDGGEVREVRMEPVDACRLCVGGGLYDCCCCCCCCCCRWKAFVRARREGKGIQNGSKGNPSAAIFELCVWHGDHSLRVRARHPLTDRIAADSDSSNTSTVQHETCQPFPLPRHLFLG